MKHWFPELVLIFILKSPCVKSCVMELQTAGKQKRVGQCDYHPPDNFTTTIIIISSSSSSSTSSSSTSSSSSSSPSQSQSQSPSPPTIHHPPPT
ncbi:MAG: hypothetical protein ACKPKO_50190, partial [Candidatus Fonsibacter sp.]